VDHHLSLSTLDRRRAQLWTMSVLLVMSVSGVIALLSVGRGLIPDALRLDQLSGWIAGVLVAGLALAFLVYVWEKERDLRRLTRLLIEERVRSEALDGRVTEMARLSDVTRAVNGALHRNNVFDTILRSALDLLEASGGVIFLLDDDGRALAPVASSGLEDVAPKPVEEGIEGRVALTRAPLLREPPGDATARTSIVVPLLRDDELLGVIRLDERRRGAPFAQPDLDALGFFAEHAAVAIGNARLLEMEREAVARLEELNSLKNDFVATVSHELRTPLTAIVGAAKTMARSGLAMEPHHHDAFLTMIERQADRLLRLVQDVLTASRMESAQPRLQREFVDLKALTQGIIEDFSHTTLGAGRRVVLRTQPERPTTWADVGAVEQIMSNLIENALKYSSADVHVTLTETASEGIVEVVDRGEGMSAEQLATIFERFHQAEPSLRSAGGVGLGLFIVKNLVEAHNGHVDVASEEGVGTCFTVRLPKRAAERENT
jgi:signal transduction histidine kinase